MNYFFEGEDSFCLRKWVPTRLKIALVVGGILNMISASTIMPHNAFLLL